MVKLNESNPGTIYGAKCTDSIYAFFKVYIHLHSGHVLVPVCKCISIPGIHSANDVPIDVLYALTSKDIQMDVVVIKSSICLIEYDGNNI